eukprot:gene36619-44422_t
MSSGHLKKEEDGLDVNAMNMYWGGKQRSIMRPTKITTGCLGPHRPTLREGDTQYMNFQHGEDILIWKGKDRRAQKPQN